MTLALWLAKSLEPSIIRSGDGDRDRDVVGRPLVGQKDILEEGNRVFREGQHETGLRLTQLALRMESTKIGLMQLGEQLSLTHRFEEARDTFRKVLYGLSGPENPEAAHFLGVVEAQLGNFEVSRALLVDYLARDRSIPFVFYYLASVLAFLKRFREADILFAEPLKLQIAPDRFVTTDIISFDRVPQRAGEPTPLAIFWCAEARRETMQDVDVVQFICCDSEYFHLFAEPAFRSTSQNAGMKAGFHVHVINPDAASIDRLSRLSRRVGAPVTYSTSTVELDSFTDAEKATYYSTARFLMLPELLRLYRRPTLMTDADQLVVKPLIHLIGRTEGKDLALLHFTNQRHNFLSMMSASVVIAQPTERADAFFSFIRTYIALSIGDRLLSWHLDQAALAVAFLSGPEADIELLEGQIMESKVHSARDDIDSKALFWSVTYSIPENAAKLEQPLFQDYI